MFNRLEALLRGASTGAVRRCVARRCENETVTTGDLDDPATTDAVVASLRESGARFAFVHGSRATRTATPESDLDVAAWWGTSDRPDPWDVMLPPGVDLLVLDDAALELAGRVAVHGRLLFDDDPPARVEWQATTRLVYFDEEWRQRWITETFIEAHARGR